jgi:hypothetical protein
MKRAAALFACILTAACNTYAADYWKPKGAVVDPELGRYGLNATQSQCVRAKLASGLSHRQLRMLEASARSAAQSGLYPKVLAPRHLVFIASTVRDRAVGPVVAEAASSCGIAVVETVSAPQPAPVSAGSPEPAQRQSIWLNLGAAPTGQQIAIDASSIEEKPPHRLAWFRLINPGQPPASGPAYRLQIDCAKRTINSMALRRPTGAVTEYGPGGEGAAPVERGTVMEIAWLALCT